jgi:hypothetical protein
MNATETTELTLTEAILDAVDEAPTPDGEGVRTLTVIERVRERIGAHPQDVRAKMGVLRRRGEIYAVGDGNRWKRARRSVVENAGGGR